MSFFNIMRVICVYSSESRVEATATRFREMKKEMCQRSHLFDWWHVHRKHREWASFVDETVKHKATKYISQVEGWSGCACTIIYQILKMKKKRGNKKKKLLCHEGDSHETFSFFSSQSRARGCAGTCYAKKKLHPHVIERSRRDRKKEREKKKQQANDAQRVGPVSGLKSWVDIDEGTNTMTNIDVQSGHQTGYNDALFHLDRVRSL